MLNMYIQIKMKLKQKSIETETNHQLNPFKLNEGCVGCGKKYR